MSGCFVDRYATERKRSHCFCDINVFGWKNKISQFLVKMKNRMSKIEFVSVRERTIFFEKATRDVWSFRWFSAHRFTCVKSSTLPVNIIFRHEIPHSKRPLNSLVKFDSNQFYGLTIWNPIDIIEAKLIQKYVNKLYEFILTVIWADGKISLWMKIDNFQC